MLGDEDVFVARLRLIVDGRVIATTDGNAMVEQKPPWDRVALVVSTPGSDAVFDNLLVRAR